MSSLCPLSWPRERLNCLCGELWGHFSSAIYSLRFCVLALREEDFGGHSAIYWEVKYPFPLSNRDVSFRQRAVGVRAERGGAGTFNQSEASTCT